ncbi:LysR family transcriptional regulator [Pseudomonas petrae]|uniref:LysR family transcriptional regulator n=1 Tax=Pseudomonas petrae TaxID=2912190 RepID=A0ABS9IEB7_9PSED|nr:LysR family transcriptional regulator [Pseudomonas petrae]MCF7545418.1 LysR family transcriptional regulator [Pseudomonas petrae]
MSSLVNINLNRLEAFVAIVNSGSLTGAAQAIGTTKAMVSMSLKLLEAELGCSLLTRTTRRMSLTDVGERFYADCVGIIEQAQTAIETARQGHASLTGELRITSTLEYGVHFVVRALAAFAKLHPQLKVNFSSSIGLADLVSERFDLAIRMGQLIDSGYRALPLRKFALVLVATPTYLQSRGWTHVPEDVQSLEWVFLSGFNARMKLSRRDSPNIRFSLSAPISIQTDSASAVLQFVLQSSGIAPLPDWMVEEALEDGRLVQVLPEYEWPEQGIYAVFPNTQHVQAKVRSFIDFFREFQFAQAPI